MVKKQFFGVGFAIEQLTIEVALSTQHFSNQLLKVYNGGLIPPKKGTTNFSNIVGDLNPRIFS